MLMIIMKPIKIINEAIKQRNSKNLLTEEKVRNNYVSLIVLRLSLTPISRKWKNEVKNNQKSQQNKLKRKNQANRAQMVGLQK